MIKKLLDKLNNKENKVDKNIIIEERVTSEDREAAEALQFMMAMSI